jgi:3-polyprenyl-4-hydroxybenzoate decarboxylase
MRAFTQTAPSDLQKHLARLTERGLVTVIDKSIDKDSELHPLVRWQFQGGLRDDERRAFLFTNVTGAKGEKYDIPVLAGGLAASPEIYATGLGVPVEEIGKVWVKGVAEPVAPVLVDDAPCQEVVETGDDLKRKGLSALPCRSPRPASIPRRI